MQKDRRHRQIVFEVTEREEKMLEIIFAICMIWVFGKLFFFGLKAAWGITKMIFFIVFLPVILIGMVVGGLIYIALPVVLIIGIVSLVTSK